MKIDTDSTRDRLENVPLEKRIYLYDGSRVLEFLKRSFIPVDQFMVPNAQVHTRELNNGDWEGGKKQLREDNMSLKDVYELYKVFYQLKGWTTPIETAFQFGLMIRRLRFYKNNWEFDVYRVGSAQIWHVAPIRMRADASLPMPEDKEQDIAVTFADMQSDQEEDEGEEVEPTTIELDIKANPEQTQATVTLVEVPLVQEVDEVIAYIQTPEQVAQEEAFLAEVHPALPTDY